MGRVGSGWTHELDNFFLLLLLLNWAEKNISHLPLGVCMSQVRSVEKIFWPNPPWWTKKKFNPTHHISPTQPIWVKLNPWVGQLFLLLLLLNWAEKNISHLPLGVCMSRVGLVEEIFWPNPPWWTKKKKFNPTQPNPTQPIT